MKYFAVVVVFALFASTWGNRELCPHPEEVGEQVASESIRLDAPLAGHAAIEIDLSERILGRNFSCFTLVTRSQNTGPHIVSIGINRYHGGSAKVYTEEKMGLDAYLQAYTPKTPGPRPGPGPQPTPEPYPPQA